jgi:predicted adenylyl cyclase CyaB
MNHNVEIKARVDDLEGLARRAGELAGSAGKVLVQEDVFFNSGKGRLKLRTINGMSSELIYYERADEEGPKNSSYLLVPVSEPVVMRRVLESAYGVRGVVRKRRRLFIVGITRVHLDEVEGLGNFMELEVVLVLGQTTEEGVKIANAIMGELRVEESSLLRGAYIDLMNVC